MASTKIDPVTLTSPIETQDYPLPVNPPSRRLESIDLLRGLLMILMALDHTRDFFTAFHVNPTDPVHSWPALFATRWVTHLCAPGFIALAGASTYLQKVRDQTSKQVGRLLWTRGLWLVFLEVTVISFGWSFNFSPFLQVIWAIGLSMIALSWLQRLPVAVVGTVGALILLCHNLLDPIDADRFGRFADLWDILHQTAMLTYHGRPFAFAFYPVLPWFGVMCVGYAFGPLAAKAPAVRQLRAAILGMVFLAAFTCLRFAGVYGDDNAWQHFASPARTAMSFLQVEKYPPSLEYALATLAVLLMLYAFFDFAVSRNWLPPLRRFVEVYGRVPFFYYVLHIYLIHASAILLAMAMHLDWHYFIGPGILRTHPLPGWGVSMPVMYCLWIGFVLVLYLPCRWFSGVKARRRDWWLSYL